MADESKKKIIIVSVSSLVLVAMVIAVTFSSYNDDSETSSPPDNISSSQKALQTICAPTDYKDACFDSLKTTAENTSDPKELIEAAFRATIKYISDAAENSTLLQELENDPRTKLALDNCRELAHRAIDDLEKTYDKFQAFVFSNLDEMFADFQTWLSGAITYQETCLDGFEETEGEAGEKMRHALKTAMQLTSNALAMITDISSVLSSLEMTQAESPTSRRLLSDDPLPVLAHGDLLPEWFDAGKRRLLRAPPKVIKPDLTVAKDGTGKFRTINEALKEIPKKSERTFVLYIKEGIYEEKVQFNSSLTHLMVIGDGPTKTRITGSLNFIDGVPTYHTATVAVLGDYFIAKDIGFENTAGAAKHQAVALRVGADKAVFYNCHMDGYQDTLYTHTYRQFYRNCLISGTIDFVFGDAAAVFQNCTFVVRKPLANQQCIVTAQGRKDIRQPTGLVLQNCSFVADPEYYPIRNISKSYLGRPWKEFSRTVIMESFIDDLIQPQGWLPWNDTFAIETLFYTEFNNRGPGASKENRIKWSGVKELPAKRIKRFTAVKFIEAKTWLPATGVPFNPTFIFPPPKENENVVYSPPSSQENKDLGKKKDRDAYVASSGDSSSDKKDKKDKKQAPAPASIPFSAPSYANNATPASGPAPMFSWQYIAPVAVPVSAPVSVPVSAPVSAPIAVPLSAPDSSVQSNAPSSNSAPTPSLQYSDISSPAPAPAPNSPDSFMSSFPGFL